MPPVVRDGESALFLEVRVPHPREPLPETAGCRVARHGAPPPQISASRSEKGAEEIVALHVPIHETIYRDSTLQNDLIDITHIAEGHPAGPHVVDHDGSSPSSSRGILVLPSGAKDLGGGKEPGLAPSAVTR
jgi:hypothetical protein